LGHHNHYIGHANSIYQVVLGVPLIVRVPGVAPAVVGQQVEITDIAPTLLDLVRLESPESMEGRSFQGLLAGKRGREKKAAFSEWYGENGQTVYTVRRGRGKYVHNPAGVRPNDVPYCYHPGTGFDLEQAELYDLERDPQETRNLAETRPHVVASLRTQLEEWLDAHEPPPSPAPLTPDEETLEELKALGYLK
jgi:arylsulfatase A-like enzyme